MSWATRRKSIYIGSTLIFFLVVLGIPAFFILYEKPTCTDGKQNGSEFGIDCGGVCERLCRSQYLPPLVAWSRSAEVEPGLYNAVAYIENQNLDAYTDAIPYSFKFYDKDNILIYERSGETFVPPNKSLAVFLEGVSTGARIPVRVTFEFTREALWKAGQGSELSLFTGERKLSLSTTTPRIDAELSNRAIVPVRDIEVIAIVYDSRDNAIAFSRTYVPEVSAEGSVPLVFTWRVPFTAEAARFELLPRVLK